MNTTLKFSERNLVIIADSMEECVRRLLIWKEVMERKGLWVYSGKPRVIICGTGLDHQQSSCEYPCAVCDTGVLTTTASSAMAANSGSIRNAVSGLQRLTPNLDYRWELPALY